MDDTIDSSELKALLRELEDVVGSSADATEGATARDRPFSGRVRGSTNVDVLVSRYFGQLGPAKFSTYADTTNDTSRRAVVPLWERLPPLSPLGTATAGGAGSGGEMSRGSVARHTFLRPKLVGGAVGESLQRMPLEEMRNILSPSKKDTKSGGGEQAHMASSPSAKQEEERNEETQREVNFLPIMCARFINPAGITPRGRWGHTLTSMQGHKLLLFGGMDLKEGETASLFEYDAHHVSWDPVFVSSRVSPTPRTNHAACAASGRWLYVSGGTTDCGSTVLGDLYCFDTYTQEWKCLWEYDSSSVQNKNEPTPRFGHSMIFRDGRLYIFGGKTLRRDHGNAHKTQNFPLATTDVYVFSLTCHRWRKRIHLGKVGSTEDEKNTPSKEVTPSTTTATTNTNTTSPLAVAVVKADAHRPANRCFHAACLLGDCMYINGGVGDGGVILSDTWVLDLKKQKWTLLHNGGNADAFPREKHHLFACGEALLVVGGCSPSGHSARITLKYHNFVAVLPLQSDVAPCWIPVAMGNVSIVAPNKKSFGAAFSGGFVHIFGGVCGSEPASKSMVRFLAADGCFATDSCSATRTDAEALTAMMRHIRETGIASTVDTYVLPRSWDGEKVIDTLSNRPYAVHRVMLQQRAPRFWEDLSQCRMENIKHMGSDNALPSEEPTSSLNPRIARGNNRNQDGVTTTTTAHTGHAAVAYFTEGNSRIQGLSVPMSADQLQYLLDYIYWGDVHHRILLEHEEEEGTEDVNTLGQKTVLEEEVNNIQVLRRAAEKYELHPLMDVCDALLARSRKKLKKAQERSIKQLQSDLLSLLESSNSATVTVLFMDPHTEKQTVYSLHPFILMASNLFFNDLLRPLLTGEKKTFHVGSVAAKMRSKDQSSSSVHTRRDILVGPVSVPSLAVQPILHYLYTQRLTVPREAVFATLLGSHLLDVAPLQAYCESVLAREEVNYDTAAQFYSLAGKYHAPLLQETALLTAVLGYAEVRRSPGYKSLSEKEVREIDAVATELGATSWIAPPQIGTEVKPSGVYQQRWNASLSA